MTGVVCMLYRTLVRQGEGAHWSQANKKQHKHMQEKKSNWLRRSTVNAVTLKKESDVLSIRLFHHVFLKYEAGFVLSEVTSGLTLGFTVIEVLHFSHRHSKLCSGADSVQDKQSTHTKPWLAGNERLSSLWTFLKTFPENHQWIFFLPLC